MELLDHNRLQGHRQWRLAQMILSFVGHGYVWQEGDHDIPTVSLGLHVLSWYELVLKFVGIFYNRKKFHSELFKSLTMYVFLTLGSCLCKYKL